MADETEYMSYEQVLQELQINRSQLNQLIREGRLREHVVEGETKFRLVEVRDVRKTLEKRPTVVEAGRAEEPTTDVLEDEAAVVSKEPETEMLEEEEAPSAERETDLLEETPAVAAVERDTEILEEGAPAAEEELELEEPLAAEDEISESAFETELELKAAEAEAEESPAEDAFFDFSEEDEFELEGAEPAVAEIEPEEEEEIVTDILDLGVEEEVPEEDLLSEIMDIEEEQAEGVGDETDDLTAEITTLEEPTYEDSDLGEVLEVGEEFEVGEEAGEGEEFELAYAEPVAAPAEQMTGAWVAMLCLTVLFMVIAVLFVVENGFRPDFSTHLTGWAPFGP